MSIKPTKKNYLEKFKTMYKDEKIIKVTVWLIPIAIVVMILQYCNIM